MFAIIKSIVVACTLVGVSAGACKAESCDLEGQCTTKECSVIEIDSKAKPAARGRMVSCKGCKLNHYESLRKWVKLDQKWKEYQNIEMQWIQGHDPILFILDEEGEEKDRVDMTDYDYDSMPKMLKRKGFKLKGEF